MIENGLERERTRGGKWLREQRPDQLRVLLPLMSPAMHPLSPPSLSLLRPFPSYSSHLSHSALSPIGVPSRDHSQGSLGRPQLSKGREQNE